MTYKHSEEKRRKGRTALARWKIRNPEKAERSTLNTFLKKHYGITYDEYDDMVHAQDGLCAVCRQPETAVRHGRVQRLSVDHDHTTGRVRGLLCGNCNTALGLLAEDVLRLHALVSYIEHHRTM